MGQVVSMSEHKKRKRRAGSFRWLVIIFMMLACCVIGYGLAQSPIFNITKINVSGNTNITTEEVISLSGLTEGEHIYSLSMGRAETMIATNPWVDSVTVKRSLPNKVNITVKERVPVAVVPQQQALLIVDASGYVLRVQRMLEDSSLMTLSGIDDLMVEVAVLPGSDSTDAPADGADGTSTEPADDDAGDTEETTDGESQTQMIDDPLKILPGVKLYSDKLTAGLALIVQLNEESAGVISELNVANAQNIVAHTVYNVDIYLGDKSDFIGKFNTAKAIFRQEEAKGMLKKLKYVDVSIISQPTLKYN